MRLFQNNPETKTLEEPNSFTKVPRQNTTKLNIFTKVLQTKANNCRVNLHVTHNRHSASQDPIRKQTIVDSNNKLKIQRRFARDLKTKTMVATTTRDPRPAGSD